MSSSIEQTIESVFEVLDGLEQGICILDSSLNIFFWNQWLATKTGLGAESLIGKPFLSVVTDKAKTYLKTRLENSLLNGQPDFLSQAFNHYILAIPISYSNNFELMQQKVRLKPIVQADGTQMLVVMIEDVTIETDRVKDLNRNRKNLESIIARRTAKLAQAKLELEAKVLKRTEELAQAKEAAERATEAKSSFLSNISHEIRTPMNAILGMTHLALESDLQTDVREQLDVVLSASNNMLDLVNNVLDFSKIESGKMEISNHPFDLHEEVQSILGLFQSRFSTKGIRLLCDIAEDVPKNIESDELRVRQILVNLLGNALKFTATGQVKLWVKVISSPLEALILQFEVTDTDIGIPKTKQESIFEGFIQADDSVTRQYGGTGLGLSITKKLVGLLGGDIWVQAQEGKGSSFFFTLRCKKFQVQVPAAVLSEVAKTPDFASLDILIVEDNQVNQKLVLRMLAKTNAKVVVAGNGEEAVGLLQGQSFDVILMDIQMPILDGLQTTRLIRSGGGGNQNSAIPIIAMTANAFDTDRKACFDAGMNDFIAKPFSKKILFDRLAHFMP